MHPGYQNYNLLVKTCLVLTDLHFYSLKTTCTLGLLLTGTLVARPVLRRLLVLFCSLHSAELFSNFHPSIFFACSCLHVSCQSFYHFLNFANVSGYIWTNFLPQLPQTRFQQNFEEPNNIISVIPNFWSRIFGSSSSLMIFDWSCHRNKH